MVTSQPALASALGASDGTAAAYVAMAEATLGFLDNFLVQRAGPTNWPGKRGLRSPLGTAEHLAARENTPAFPPRPPATKPR